jgi:hypothetical protein
VNIIEGLGLLVLAELPAAAVGFACYVRRENARASAWARAHNAEAAARCALCVDVVAPMSGAEQAAAVQAWAYDAPAGPDGVYAITSAGAR